ncbi:MAG: hypothetical protein J6Z04_02320 [Clostridia bacterium]|nr:hypothetical protein [Clostridia bacterium]
MAKTVQSVVKRRVKSAAKRTAKRNPAAVIALIFVLVAGLLVGYFACKALVKNDGFQLKGEKEISFTVGDGDGSVTLAEPGWTLTALGRDASGSVKVETELQQTEGGYTVPTDEAGVYRIVYRPTHFLFSKYSLIRTVTVNDAEGGDE